MAPTFVMGNVGYHLRAVCETKEENPVPGSAAIALFNALGFSLSFAIPLDGE
jgi:hypothetical protein